MTVTSTVDGVDQLTASLGDLADALGDLSGPSRVAADEVLGYITHPHAPAGIARDLHVEADALGFTLAAHGTSESFLTVFLTTPLTDHEDAVVGIYADHLEQLVDQIEGA